MNRRDLLKLVLLLGVCLGTGALGGLFTSTSVSSWYPTLPKPSWTPPGWVFGPVWTLLYVTMAVAAWRVWRQAPAPGVPLALGLFVVQLLLNLAWSALFFGLRRPDLALAEIAVLWAAIVACTVAFWRVSPLGGALLLPYLAWVSFAAALNLAIWRMWA